MAMLRPAEEMKDSGIEWVGFVPQDWNVVPIGSCFDEVVKKNKEGLVKNALKFTYGQIVPKTNFDADEDDYVADTILNYYIVDPGTIMINGLNLNFDLISQRTALVKERGIITSAYVGIIPKDFSVTLPDFMNYLFKAYDYRMAFHNMGGGVRKILNFTRLKSQKVCFPTITEQQAIADYLDDRCSRLDEIITEAEKSIEEYKELKQAVIFEAVTKGLDKNVPMKDSGVEWIGEIPITWNMTILRRFCSFQTGKTPSTSVPEWFDGDVNWFTPGDFSERYYLEDSRRKLSQKALNDSAAITVDDNCVMIVGIGGSAGKVGLTKVPCSCNQQVTAVMSSVMDPKYLMYYLELDGKYLKETAMFTTLPILNNDTLGNSPLVVPAIKEQKNIADYLDSRLIAINALIGEKQVLVNELQTYKKSIIYEVVTGKKRVVV